MINSSTGYRTRAGSHSTENSYVVRLKRVVKYLQKPQSTTAALLDYGKAILLTLVALLMTSLINEVLDGRFVFVFMIAVVLSSYHGGLGPGLLTSLLSVILIRLFFSPAEATLTRNDDLILPAIFAVLSLFITWLEAGNVHARQQLMENTRQLELIFNGINDGITVQGKDERVIFANEAASNLMGLPSVEFMTGNPVAEIRKRYDYFNEQGQPLDMDLLPARQVMKTGQKAELTIRIKYRQSGDERWLLVKSSPLFDHRNKPYQAISIFQDVTERRQAEQERMSLLMLVEQQRRRLQNVFDNVPGIVWESKYNPATNQQEIVFVSNYSQTMLGYTPEEWLNEPDFMRKVIHPDDWDSLVEQAKAIFKSGKPGTLEFRFIARDGREVCVEAPTIFMQNEVDQVIGVCGLFMDVSARKEAEAILAKSAVDLKRSNDELKQFAYVASHDLQEPLRMVGSYLQLIERRYNDSLDSDGREFIAYAVDGANRMKSLLNDLLTYSRVETREQDFTQVNFQKTFHDACKLLEMTISDTGAVITCDLLPKVKGDEDLLRQLFQNLLSNCLKYRGEQPPKIHIGLKRKDKEWLFSVQDNGIGIEEQYLDRIFVIFQKLHPRGQYPGTGIGLAICKKVVERHGGRIWAESKVGHGSTFYFTLPA